MSASEREKQACIWDYYKPRHTHAWNMLMLSWRELDQASDQPVVDFQPEYFWENYILRLWLYRTTVRTLTKLAAVEDHARKIITIFDENFYTNDRNSLKALRDMIEHFDDYAAGEGRGPGSRIDLDPWRFISPDRYERGQYFLEREKSFEAVTRLRSDAKGVSNEFIEWFKSSD